MEKKEKKYLRMKERGDSEKAILGWYTASSRYRARNAKDREAIGRATADKTWWGTQKQRARNHIKAWDGEILI